MNIVVKKPKKIQSQIVKNNRIGNRIISRELITVKDFNINGALHSINIEEKFFTNYVKSYDKKIYKELKEIFDEVHYCQSTLEQKFILLNNDKDSEIAQKRLNDIIKENLNIDKVPGLMKFKPKHPKEDKTLEGVRIYVYYDMNVEEFDLYLVDLYHLGVEGYNANIGKYDLKHRYKINSECKKCISKIADEYNFRK